MDLSKESSPLLQCLEGIINPGTELHQSFLEAKTLARCCPLDNSQDRCHRAPINSGMLETLPRELLNAVLVQLDVQSLTNFRRVSQNSRLAVDAILPYRTLRAQAPELLRAVLSHGIGRWTLIQDLFDALLSRNCAGCGDFGPFIYLLSCSRACFKCVCKDLRFSPQPASTAKAKYGLDDRALAGLPTLRSLPGSSTHKFKTHGKSLALVDWKAAKETAIALQDQFEKAQRAQGCWPKDKHGSPLRGQPGSPRRVDSSRAWPGANEDEPMTHFQRIMQEMQEMNDKVDYSFNQHRTITTKTRRVPHIVGIIRVPWLNSASGKLECGISCKGCRRGGGPWRTYRLRRSSSDWTRIYSHNDFLEHLKCCTAGLPNEHWPKSLASIMTRDESIEGAGQRETHDAIRSLDPCFLNDIITLVLKAYNKSRADIEGVGDVDGAGEIVITGAQPQVNLLG